MRGGPLDDVVPASINQTGMLVVSEWRLQAALDVAAMYRRRLKELDCDSDYGEPPTMLLAADAEAEKILKGEA